MEDVRALGARLRNWGRWGPDDERGTLNHITPERLVAAARLVREGQDLRPRHPVRRERAAAGRRPDQPRPPHVADRRHPGVPRGFKYADDYIFMPLQGATQWDSLAHVYYDDQIYGGFPSSDVTVVGAFHCTIDKIAKGVAGRGVLLDIARLKGVDWLDLGYAVTPDDLEGAMAAQGGVEVGPGDIVVFRTGWRRFFLERGSPQEFMAGEPGLGQDCCEWLHARDVAAVCSDNWAIEVLPGENPEAIFNVHMVLIRDMGMTLGEILDLEELTADCAADGVWEFFFCAPPLKVTKGVGSPINPLAMK